MDTTVTTPEGRDVPTRTEVGDRVARALAVIARGGPTAEDGHATVGPRAGSALFLSKMSESDWGSNSAADYADNTAPPTAGYSEDDFPRPPRSSFGDEPPLKQFEAQIGGSPLTSFAPTRGPFRSTYNPHADSADENRQDKSFVPPKEPDEDAIREDYLNDVWDTDEDRPDYLPGEEG